KNVGKGRCKIGSESRRSGARALFKGRVAEAIIGRAFIGILKNVIGLVDLFEPMLAFLVAWIAIRMVLHRELAKRCLEFRLLGGTRDAKNFIIVALGHPLAHPKRKPHPPTATEIVAAG